MRTAKAEERSTFTISMPFERGSRDVDAEKEKRTVVVPPRRYWQLMTIKQQLMHLQSS